MYSVLSKEVQHAYALGTGNMHAVHMYSALCQTVLLVLGRPGPTSYTPAGHLEVIQFWLLAISRPTDTTVRMHDYSKTPAVPHEDYRRFILDSGLH